MIPVRANIRGEKIETGTDHHTNRACNSRVKRRNAYIAEAYA
jgi:hypothetical protein